MNMMTNDRRTMTIKDSTQIKGIAHQSSVISHFLLVLLLLVGGMVSEA